MNEDDESDGGPALAPADDAFVAELLGGLPAEPMPAAVSARLHQALAALAGTVDEPVDEPVAAAGAATVVPLSAAAGRGPARWRNPRVLQAAAALVLVVGGGVAAVKVLGGHSDSASTASAAGSEQKAAVGLSDHAYSAKTLPSDIALLVAGRIATDSASTGGPVGASVPAVPSPQSGGGGSTPPTTTFGTSGGLAALRSMVSSTTTLAPCLAAVEEGLPQYVAPYAMDAGTYDGKPALIVVLPGSDSSTYDVWVVGPDCGKAGDADLIAYRSVPRG